MDLSRLLLSLTFPVNLFLVFLACRLCGMDRYDIRHATWWLMIVVLALSVLESIAIDRALARWGRLDAEDLRWRERLSYGALAILVVVTAGLIIYHRSEEAREREEEAQRRQNEAEEARLREQAADGVAALQAFQERRLHPTTAPATMPSVTAPAAVRSSVPAKRREGAP